ncbi:beta-amyrin 28-monooxygenase [Aplysia californica]|uniref:Beta-amyrin 28-monooxygenase n=1 Tax=Aplysia californica TaxID=6500 RepID=A0ABM0JI40_APLCA|nr:beta-amyrin 28-monooxygenase [Aplysia californica]XP_005094135.1 beta-amyrin 28-monooxygenase [Aplysia californica]XP_005094136.1 beta-amyrin 28-monooxygenase [Aplysia californica]XP_012935562.1 beta-amyrin 28-monooxygenase [Aplysia californica]
MEIPGKVGWPIVGDKSIEFYRDPLKFLEKNMAATKSKIFAARFLNKPTLFVCSSEGVQEVLNDSEQALEMGYEQFMGQMFGHNILFSTNEMAVGFRHSLSQLMTSQCLSEYEETLQRILVKKMSTLNAGSPFCLYQFFKDLFTEVCLTLFLGVEFSENEETAELWKGLTSDHWHGIVSVPVDLKLPGTGTQSTFSKALKAKAKLLELISSQKNKVTCGFPHHMKSIEEFDETAVNQHLLLFTSALVPKVLSSICTSVCIEMGNPDRFQWQEKAKKEPKFLDNLILETQRLHPPLLGGRRMVKKKCVIAGYAVPKGHAVVYMTQPAHRDSAVFDHPDQFLPERWDERPELIDKLFVYGLGPRGCIGYDLSRLIIQKSLTELLSRFTWQICEDQVFTHKHIPVSRPKCNLLVTVTPV